MAPQAFTKITDLAAASNVQVTLDVVWYDPADRFVYGNDQARVTITTETPAQMLTKLTDAVVALLASKGVTVARTAVFLPSYVKGS